MAKELRENLRTEGLGKETLKRGEHIKGGKTIFSLPSEVIFE